MRKCVVAGFFSNAARLAPDGSYVTVRDGRRVLLDPNSVLAKFGEASLCVVALLGVGTFLCDSVSAFPRACTRL